MEQENIEMQRFKMEFKNPCKMHDVENIVHLRVCVCVCV